MNMPVLYSFRRCPYAMRARLAIAVSRVQCELREIKLSAKPEPMLQASPKGTVPVLVLPEGEVIDQSLDIMHWALQIADPENWLSHNERDLITLNDTTFKFHLDRYKYPNRYDSNAHEHRTAGISFLETLQTRLHQHCYLSGSQFGLTDAAILPFIRQFSAVDTEWFSSLNLPALQNWLHQFLESPRFIEVMPKFKPWQPEDTPTLFPQIQS